MTQLDDKAVQALTEVLSHALMAVGGTGHFVMIFPMESGDEFTWDSRVISTVPPAIAAEVMTRSAKEMIERGMRNTLEDKLN